MRILANTVNFYLLSFIVCVNVYVCYIIITLAMNKDRYFVTWSLLIKDMFNTIIHYYSYSISLHIIYCFVILFA